MSLSSWQYLNISLKRPYRLSSLQKQQCKKMLQWDATKEIVAVGRMLRVECVCRGRAAATKHAPHLPLVQTYTVKLGNIVDAARTGILARIPQPQHSPINNARLCPKSSGSLLAPPRLLNPPLLRLTASSQAYYGVNVVDNLITFIMMMNHGRIVRLCGILYMSRFSHM